jgi:hypothetical protein
MSDVSQQMSIISNRMDSIEAAIATSRSVQATIYKLNHDIKSISDLTKQIAMRLPQSINCDTDQGNIDDTKTVITSNLSTTTNIPITHMDYEQHGQTDYTTQTLASSHKIYSEYTPEHPVTAPAPAPASNIDMMDKLNTPIPDLETASVDSSDDESAPYTTIKKQRTNSKTWRSLKFLKYILDVTTT